MNLPMDNQCPSLRTQPREFDNTCTALRAHKILRQMHDSGTIARSSTKIRNYLFYKGFSVLKQIQREYRKIAFTACVSACADQFSHTRAPIRLWIKAVPIQ
jgi:hypothetical protein